MTRGLAPRRPSPPPAWPPPCSPRATRRRRRWAPAVVKLRLHCSPSWFCVSLHSLPRPLRAGRRIAPVCHATLFRPRPCRAWKNRALYPQILDPGLQLYAGRSMGSLEHALGKLAEFEAEDAAEDGGEAEVSCSAGCSGATGRRARPPPGRRAPVIVACVRLSPACCHTLMRARRSLHLVALPCPTSSALPCPAWPS